ncbi:MAG: LysR family transcriptional regulator [Pseudorhodobacter sp.]|nr:LysR family transcriptional regulator [Pseudorhodobacter sp.]
MTHHIAQIERDLGAPVLVRHQSGVRPTELGERLMAHAAEILDRVGQAEHDLLLLAHQGTVPEKTIHLAIIPSLASALTAEFIAGFAEILPHVDLHLIEARSGYCGTLIETGKADIAIQLVNPDEVESEPLIWESLYWITLRKDRPVAGPVRLAEILQTPLILPSLGNPLRQCLQTEAEAHGPKLQVTGEVDGPDPRRRAVLAGLGTAVFGAHSVAAGLLGPLLLAHPIVNPVLTRPIVMMVRKDFDPAMATLIRAAPKRILAAAPQVQGPG